MEDDRSSSRRGVDSNMAPPTEPQQTFRFLDLPRELQHMVMDNVFQRWEFKLMYNHEKSKYFVDGANRQPFALLLVNRYFYTIFKDEWVSSCPTKVTIRNDSSLSQEQGQEASLSKEALSKHVQKFAHKIESVVSSSWSAGFMNWVDLFPNMRSFQIVHYDTFMRCWDIEDEELDIHLLDLIQGRLDHEFHHAAEFVSDIFFKADSLREKYVNAIGKNPNAPSISMRFGLVFEFKKAKKKTPKDHFRREFRNYNMPGDQFVIYFEAFPHKHQYKITGKEFRKTKDFQPGRSKRKLPLLEHIDVFDGKAWE